MASERVRPSGHERTFGEDEIIVSKTDQRGVITYANQVFARIAGYTIPELLGAPHSIVRHPAMPRCVFKLLWDTIQAGREIFAYVLNMARNGDHYWVLAHVTPTFDGAGTIIGYHSTRRCPSRAAIARIEPVYTALLAEESRHASKQDAIAAATRLLTQTLATARMNYDEFAWSLENAATPVTAGR